MENKIDKLIESVKGNDLSAIRKAAREYKQLIQLRHDNAVSKVAMAEEAAEHYKEKPLNVAERAEKYALGFVEPVPKHLVEDGPVRSTGKYTIDDSDKPRYQRENTRVAYKMMGTDAAVAEDPEHLESIKARKAEIGLIDAKDNAIKERYERMLASRELSVERSSEKSENESELVNKPVEREVKHEHKPERQIQEESTRQVKPENNQERFEKINQDIRSALNRKPPERKFFNEHKVYQVAQKKQTSSQSR